MSDLKADGLEPDQVAEWLYSDSVYPDNYKVVVAESYAKQEQYAQIVQHISVPKQIAVPFTILEPGPSNVPILKNALQNANFPLKHCRLLGLDPFPRMHPPDLEMLTGSVTSIPLDDNSVDIVVMSSVLYFVTD